MCGDDRELDVAANEMASGFSRSTAKVNSRMK
jgi:hypothetical protein